MYEEGHKEGVEAYFILNFRDLNKTFGVSAELIYSFYQKSERKNIDYGWCKDNGLFIAGKLKRTRYKFKHRS